MTKTEYTINGVDMSSRSSNPMGWAIMREGTQQLAGVNRSINKVNVPGYDGYFIAPSTRTEQVMIFNISTPRENLEALLAVLALVGYDSNFPTLGKIEVSVSTGTAAYYDLVSAIPSSDSPNDSLVMVTATLNIPYGGWRDEATTTTTTSITTTPQTVALASGLSLPIRDADLFIQGDVGTFQINDNAGSWIRTTSDYVYASGKGIFFQGSTGRAFSATTGDPWTPVADISYAIDTSGGGFKMTPKFDPATPNTRAVSLQVLSLLLTGVSLKVRFRSAYVMK